MKRILLVILSLCVCLCGCVSDDPAQTTEGSSSTPATTLPEPTSLYVPGDAVEQQTQGVVKAYHLNRTGALAASMLGDKLVVFLEAGGTELMVIDPATGTLLRSVTLSCNVQPNTQAVQVSDRGIGYYDRENRTVVILDTELRETARVVLPEDLIGDPVIAPELDKVYFCTDSEIRVIDIMSGISRLLRQQQDGWESLQQLCFNGEALAYPAGTAEGSQTVFLDTATGALLGSAEGIQWMQTSGEHYILQYLDADVQIRELLYGTRGETPSKLNIPGGEAYPLQKVNAVVAADAQTALILDYYVLDSGSRTAQVQISGKKSIVDICAAQQGIVWILIWDADLQQNVLYCWDITASAVVDDAVYAGTWFTAEAPDEAGLAACQAEADAIGNKYGVDIRIGNHALEAPCDYQMEAEFHVEIFRQKLQTVDTALARFPEGILKQIGKVSGSGQLHICLVRNVADGVTGLQFWHDGEAYAAVQMNGDLEYNLYLELYFILDTYVFNNTSALDTWDWQNPKGFDYFESYSFDASQANQEWLDGEKRAFVDAFGMTYPREDRAQFFATAMTDGNNAVFESETMQAKLKFLGKGIREAFDWKKDERSFPWEQYLNEPLAYQKKKK